jgi:hypothetical protein
LWKLEKRMVSAPAEWAGELENGFIALHSSGGYFLYYGGKNETKRSKGAGLYPAV